MSQFSSVCSNFGLIISLKKNISKETDILPSIEINGKDIKNVKKFVYSDSKIKSNAPLDTKKVALVRPNARLTAEFEISKSYAFAKRLTFTFQCMLYSAIR